MRQEAGRLGRGADTTTIIGFDLAHVLLLQLLKLSQNCVVYGAKRQERKSPQCNRIVDDMMNGYEFRLTRDGKVSLYLYPFLSLSVMLAHVQSIADLWAT